MTSLTFTFFLVTIEQLVGAVVVVPHLFSARSKGVIQSRSAHAVAIALNDWMRSLCATSESDNRNYRSSSRPSQLEVSAGSIR